MKCPVCGATMNHHADKVDYSAGSVSSEKVDKDFGGVMQEVYSCPNCGNVELVSKPWRR
jgi:hypothetical protein